MAKTNWYSEIPVGVGNEKCPFGLKQRFVIDKDNVIEQDVYVCGALCITFCPFFVGAVMGKPYIKCNHPKNLE